MTEEEWLDCKDPLQMLEFLRDKASERKLRLIVVACCRRIWLDLSNESREEVQWNERLADQPTCPEAIEGIQRDVEVQIEEEVSKWFQFILTHQDGIHTEKAAYGQLLHHIFGNPFCPIAINPIWLTPTVTNLATIAYEERALPSGELDTARLTILADALEEAVCDNTDILEQLRCQGVHVRGCHVVDLILGKE